MSRDKQIEEMAKDICEIQNHGMKCAICDTGCDCRMLAEAFYNAGYRKASEVAREIISDLSNMFLDYCLQESKKYLKSKSTTKKQFQIETARFRAINEAVEFAIYGLLEIENKYTEEEE